MMSFILQTEEVVSVASRGSSSCDAQALAKCLSASDRSP